MASIKRRNGDRVAYATRDREGDSTRYAIGHDLGNPNRTAMDREINTPLGTLGYGYDGNTDYLSYQTPYVQNYPGGMSALMSGGERMGFVDRGNGGLTVGIDNVGSPYRGAYDGGFNTPIGRVNYGYDGDSSYGQIQPNYYIQALANLLMGR